jgi:hypothetical protein
MGKEIHGLRVRGKKPLTRRGGRGGEESAGGNYSAAFKQY